MAGATIRTDTKVTATTSSTQLIAEADYIPMGLILRNRSTTTTAYLKFGTGDATTDGLELKAGEPLVMQGPGTLSSRIAVITSAGTADINVVRW